MIWTGGSLRPGLKSTRVDALVVMVANGANVLFFSAAVHFLLHYS